MIFPRLSLAIALFPGYNRKKALERNDFMQPNEQSKPKKSAVRPLGRLGAFLLVTLALLLITLLGVIWVLEKGPSPTVTEKFCRSMRETSAIQWIPNIFLSQEEVDAFKSESTESDETETVNTSLIHIAPASSGTGSTDADSGVELIAITRGTAKGKLLIVHDPSRVILGVSSEEFDASVPGLQLTELVAKYNGIAGTNAGGFNDENGRGNGGVPQGLVISGGALLHTAREDERYNVVGFDADHILHVGTMTADEALAQGLTDAVSFRTHDGLASSLIINGEVQSKNLGGGVNPRTAIGQCADGSVLLLVLDGRSINTLGATMQDVADIMLEYGAVNAGNLDGGSSSVMVYDGEIINNCASVTGPRNIPTAFIVLPEGA